MQAALFRNLPRADLQEDTASTGMGGGGGGGVSLNSGLGFRGLRFRVRVLKKWVPYYIGNRKKNQNLENYPCSKLLLCFLFLLRIRILVLLLLLEFLLC